MKTIYYIITCLFLVVLLQACSNDTESKLFGKWQMRQVEAEGKVHRVDTVFYNFQHSLFMYQIVGRGGHRYGYNVLQGEKTLLLELTDYPGPVEKFLPYTDWKSRKRVFQIEKLTSGELILSSEGKRYTFREF